ncbi:Crp/Fnr family transcriptional regulator [Paraglaciecola hydrolytica]|uniref:Crp/Fnr family transcriptional regulator n=2 Tax=Paraglaciecola hydrolytica TaxID=1799789 RepID=A0A136A2I5_9ALTE|nr:Crp/Fnr family transcriptional regulator [Paraglaciecola hydrolytica]
MEFDLLLPTLQQSQWFSSLPIELQQTIVTTGTTKQLKQGHYLHRKGDKVDGLYCLISGKLRVSNLTLAGQELILTWLQVGNWFGEISMFDGLPRTHDAIAEQDCILLKLSNQDFEQLLAKQPNLYPHFMRLLCQRVRTTFKLIDEMASLSLKGQLCRRLLLLAEGLELWPTGSIISDAGLFKLTISQESLALMLHSSRQTVNKILKELQAEGLLKVHYGQITLFDKSRLLSLSQV